MQAGVLPSLCTLHFLGIKRGTCLNMQCLCAGTMHLFESAR